MQCILNAMYFGELPPVEGPDGEIMSMGSAMRIHLASEQWLIGRGIQGWFASCFLPKLVANMSMDRRRRRCGGGNGDDGSAHECLETLTRLVVFQSLLYSINDVTATDCLS